MSPNTISTYPINNNLFFLLLFLVRYLSFITSTKSITNKKKKVPTSHNPANMLPLTNKLAVITGGSRGIGLAIAHRFVRAGATTYLIARNPGPLDAAVRDLNNAAACSSDSSLFPPSPSSSSSSPIRVKAFSGSVSQEETWLRLIETLNEQRLKVDVLVNAAGMSQGSLLTKTTVDQVDDILNTNLRSAVLGSKFIGKEMVRRPKGERLDGACNIINVSSVMAMRGGTGASVYAASKAGLLGKMVASLPKVLSLMRIRTHANIYI